MENDTVSFVNQGIGSLWESWEKTLKTVDKGLRVPLVYPDLKQDVLLFIGLNPSFSLRNLRRVVRDTSYSTIDPMEFYRWHNHGEFIRETERFREIEHLARLRLEYFRKFPEIAGSVFAGDTAKWEHIDLFFCRSTNQKDFAKRILRNKAMKTFVSAQLDLSKRLVHYIEPKAIIVANALASEVFEEKLKDEFPLTWDEEYGCHVTMLKDKSISVFLASMLTGQRAMDKGSYKRLKWHIKKVVEETSNG